MSEEVPVEVAPPAVAPVETAKEEVALQPNQSFTVVPEFPDIPVCEMVSIPAPAESKGKPEFSIHISEPTRVEDGMSSHVIYTINTETTNEKFGYSQCIVVRRYNDFVWLHDILAEDYPYAVIPPLPGKNVLSKFEIEFVEIRRRSLQAFLRDVSQDPVLKESKRFRSFLSADEEKFSEERETTKDAFSMKDIYSNPAQTGLKLLGYMTSGAKALQNKVKDQLGREEAPLSKEDEKLIKYVEYLDDMAAQVEGLANHAASFTDRQREYALNQFDFGLALSLMGQLQTDAVGSSMMSLGQAMDVLCQVRQEKTNREVQAFVEPMRRVAQRMIEMKVTVARRSRILQDYQSEYSALKAAKANHKKLLATAGKESKIPAAEDEIEKHKKRAGKLKKKLNTITEKLTTVLDDFRVRKLAELRRALLDLMQIQIIYYKKMETIWKSYLTDIRQINLGEALVAAADLAAKSVDENRVRVGAGADDDDDEDSENQDKGSDDDSDEKPKKKAPAKKGKKADSDDDDSESDEKPKKKAPAKKGKKADSDDDDDDSDDDSDEKPKKKAPAKKAPAKKGKKADSDDDDDSDSDDDSDEKPKKKAPAKKAPAKKGKKADSDDDDDDDDSD